MVDHVIYRPGQVMYVRRPLCIFNLKGRLCLSSDIPIHRQAFRSRVQFNRGCHPLQRGASGLRSQGRIASTFLVMAPRLHICSELRLSAREVEGYQVFGRDIGLESTYQ